MDEHLQLSMITQAGFLLEYQSHKYVISQSGEIFDSETIDHIEDKKTILALRNLLKEKVKQLNLTIKNI